MASYQKKNAMSFKKKILIALFKSPWNEFLKKPGLEIFWVCLSNIHGILPTLLNIQTNLEHSVMSNLRDRSGIHFIKFQGACMIVASRFELKLLTDVKLLDYVYTTIF